MWKTITTVLLNLLGLAKDLEENRKEIKELNEKLYTLAGAVRSLADRVEANVQIGEVERKALLLQIQNELLKANQNVVLLSPGLADNGGKKAPKPGRSRLAK